MQHSAPGATHSRESRGLQILLVRDVPIERYPLHKRKLKFYGFDMQFASRAVKVALAYLRSVDPVEARVLEDPFTAQDYTLRGSTRADLVGQDCFVDRLQQSRTGARVHDPV